MLPRKIRTLLRRLLCIYLRSLPTAYSLLPYKLILTKLQAAVGLLLLHFLPLSLIKLSVAVGFSVYLLSRTFATVLRAPRTTILMIEAKVIWCIIFSRVRIRSRGGYLGRRVQLQLACLMPVCKSTWTCKLIARGILQIGCHGGVPGCML
jgi:hypothetical protein